MTHLSPIRAAIACLPVLALTLAGCRTASLGLKPSIQVTVIPVASVGGPDAMDGIEGRVLNGKPGQQIVLYAHSGVWWIQPLANQPFTRIQPDSTWKNTTHLGTEYAVLLVDAGYTPATKFVTLPTEGNGIEAISVVEGRSVGVGLAPTVPFSGFNWNVRTAGSDRGGEANFYDPANAWTDEKGYLHLHMGSRNGRWSCAEVSLDRSLGYGTYELVVDDAAHLSPSAVLGLFTWDDRRSEGFRNEFDIEMSRWGDASGKNAQYVLQPFYVPENLFRFSAPAGVLTHRIRWQPGSVSFETYRGATVAPGEQPLASHVFTRNVPTPATETIHLDLYDYHHAEHPGQPAGEAVIERFTFHP